MLRGKQKNSEEICITSELHIALLIFKKPLLQRRLSFNTGITIVRKENSQSEEK
jgi:hypothetical protein